MSRNVTTALYDTQFWLYFTKNTPTVQASVGATEMADSYGFGFSQIVNGLTDKGYWYQVGLAWNWWNFEGQGHYGGFEVFYQVWNSSNGQAVFPFTDGSTSPVAVPNTKEGDNVTLSLYISKGLVFMSAFDQRNGVSVTKNYTSDGATQFVSDPNSRFPTSLLTEWPHVLPYLCVNSAASFHMAGAVESGYLRIDEWNLTGVASNELFNPNIPGEFPIDTQLQPFSLQSADQSFLLSYDGMVEYASQVGFITM